MIFTLDDDKVVEGTILLFGIRYGASTSGKVYTFAGLKAGGRWYFTGTGPTDASWPAVQRWLQRDGRQVVWVKAVTGMIELWPAHGVRRPGSPYPDRNEEVQVAGMIDLAGAAKANHPSRTGSPAASMANLRLVPPDVDELLEEIPESTSREMFDDHGVDPYGD